MLLLASGRQRAAHCFSPSLRRRSAEGIESDVSEEPERDCHGEQNNSSQRLFNSISSRGASKFPIVTAFNAFFCGFFSTVLKFIQFRQTTTKPASLFAKLRNYPTIGACFDFHFPVVDGVRAKKKL